MAESISHEREDLGGSPTIAVDARALSGPVDGIGRWTLEVLPRLAALLPGRYLLASSRPIDRANLPDSRFEPLIRPGWPGSAFFHLRLPSLAEDAGAGLLLAPLNVAPVAGAVPTVVVVHDLLALTSPETQTAKIRWSLLPFWGRTLRRAAAIVTPSRTTAERLALLDAEASARAKVAPNGVAEAFRRPGPKPPDVPPRFVLSSGTLEPRKNHLLLIRAMEELWSAGETAPLLLAGKPGWRSGPLESEIDRSPFRDRIVRLGHVPDDRLAALCRAAAVFAFPSLDEGFGLPPLEAMAAGAPVVALDTAISREVLGDAALLVRNEPGGLAGALRRCLADETMRRRLSEAGRARSAPFTWDRTADVVAAACREVLAR